MQTKDSKRKQLASAQDGFGIQVWRFKNTALHWEEDMLNFLAQEFFYFSTPCT
jgi:hypothetical protein